MVSPNNVVVFGKINLISDVREIDETAGFFILQPLAANWRPWQLDLAQVKIPFKSGEEFYVVIPREEELVLLETVEQSDYGTILCRNIGFRVPADATAVFVGTFSFEEKKGTSPYSWDKDNFSVVDDYEQAVVQLHRRHSGLGGRITKSVLRYEPNLYHDGFFSNLPSRCWIQLPPPVYFFPFLPVMP